MRTIVVTKHLDRNTKRCEVLLCYELTEGVTNQEKIFFIVELDLFTSETITLLEPKKFSATIFSAIVNIEDLTFNFPL